MAQLLAVGWAFAFAATDWSGRMFLLAGAWILTGCSDRLVAFHEAGVARLERAGLRRHVDRDGVPLVGEVAGGISSSPCRTSQHSS